MKEEEAGRLWCESKRKSKSKGKNKSKSKRRVLACPRPAPWAAGRFRQGGTDHRARVIAVVRVSSSSILHLCHAAKSPRHSCRSLAAADETAFRRAFDPLLAILHWQRCAVLQFRIERQRIVPLPCIAFRYPHLGDLARERILDRRVRRRLLSDGGRREEPCLLHGFWH